MYVRVFLTVFSELLSLNNVFFMEPDEEKVGKEELHVSIYIKYTLLLS